MQIIKSKRWPSFVLFFSMLIFILLFTTLAFFKFNNFGYNGYDLAIIHQVFFRSLNGDLFFSTIHPPTYLNDHFTPIIIFLLPFYSIFPHPLTLIFLQNIALAITALPLFLISKRVLASEKTALYIAIAWLANPFVQNLALFEFHFLPFSLPLLFTSFLYYQKNKFLPFSLYFMFSLLVREDVALVAVLFGVIALIEKKSLRWVLFPIISSVLYFVSAMKIIDLNSVDRGYKFLIYYSWLGNSFAEIVKNSILQPHILLFRFFHIGNIEMLLGILLPFAFLPLLAPKYLTLSFLVYLQYFLGAPSTSSLILQTQYVTLFLPAVFLAFLFALKKIPIFKKKKILSLVLSGKLGIIILTTALVYSMILLGPIWGAFTIHLLHKNPINNEDAKILSLIPKDAPTISSYRFISHLSGREKIYGLNYIFIGKQQFGSQPYPFPNDAEYMMIDFSDFLVFQAQYHKNPLYQNTYPQGDDRIREKIEKERWGVRAIMNNTALLQKNFSSKKMLFARVKEVPPNIMLVNEPFNEQLLLKGYTLEQNTEAQILLSFFWEVQQQLSDDFTLSLTFTPPQGAPFTINQMLGYGIFPTSEWEEGALIQTNHWITLPQPLPKRSIAVNLEIFSLEEGALFIAPDRSIWFEIQKKTSPHSFSFDLQLKNHTPLSYRMKAHPKMVLKNEKILY